MKKIFGIVIVGLLIIFGIIGTYNLFFVEKEHRTFQESKYGYFWTDEFAEYGKELTIYFTVDKFIPKDNTTYKITINDKLYYSENVTQARDIWNQLYQSEKCCGIHIQVNEYLDNNFVLLFELWENQTRLDYFMLQVVSFI